ncbi:MAG: STAS domain-containing protein [Phycisphaerales bacterium]|nr:STAS domain-containing protein [Phycisphaerales bacterium]
MEVKEEQLNGHPVIAPQGDVDLGNSKDLQYHLRQSLNKKPKQLVVDLGGVPYMDSSGVATLVEAMQVSRRSGVSLVLCAMTPRVKSIFEIARLDKVFRIVDSRDQITNA